MMLDEKRTTSKNLKPTNQITGINPKRMGNTNKEIAKIYT